MTRSYIAWPEAAGSLASEWPTIVRPERLGAHHSGDGLLDLLAPRLAGRGGDAGAHLLGDRPDALGSRRRPAEHRAEEGQHVDHHHLRDEARDCAPATIIAQAPPSEWPTIAGFFSPASRM